MPFKSFIMYGFGEIGRLITQLATERRLECVGVVDVNPDLVGRDVGELMGIGKAGITVTSDAEKLIEETKPDMVLHATGSYLDRVYPQIRIYKKKGIDLVSTCETLVYPYYRYPTLANQLDNEAKQHNVRIIGAGINPGFLFDYLPAIITASCYDVESISVTRSLDASKRRQSFQKKIGIGMDATTWKNSLESGKITGHVGYAESVALLSKMLNLTLRDVYEKQEPVMSNDGRAKGLQGTAEATTREGVKINLRFIAALGAEEYDEIRIEGKPSITWRSTGTQGDIATASIILNAANLLSYTEPGLKTLTDIPVLRLSR